MSLYCFFLFFYRKKCLLTLVQPHSFLSCFYKIEYQKNRVKFSLFFSPCLLLFLLLFILILLLCFLLPIFFYTFLLFCLFLLKSSPMFPISSSLLHFTAHILLRISILLQKTILHHGGGAKRTNTESYTNFRTLEVSLLF